MKLEGMKTEQKISEDKLSLPGFFEEARLLPNNDVPRPLTFYGEMDLLKPLEANESKQFSPKKKKNAIKAFEPLKLSGPNNDINEYSIFLATEIIFTMSLH